MRFNHRSVVRDGMLALVALGLCSTESWAFGRKKTEATLPPDTVQSNPYKTPLSSRAGDVDYSVNIKFYNRGLKDVDGQKLRDFVQATENIYSQCPGVRFHVNVLGIENATYAVSDQEILLNPQGGLALGDVFENLFRSYPNNPSSGYTAVHLFDFLDQGDRERKSQKQSPIYFGQAMGANVMDNMYHDERSPQYRTGKLSDIGGNIVRLAMEAVRETDGDLTHVADRSKEPPETTLLWRSSNPTLLAHELGHILLETQSGSGNFLDHYCPGLKTDCPRGYLMSAGGDTFKEYLSLIDSDRVIGYAPIVKIDPIQCEALKRHPLVKAASPATASDAATQ